MADMSIKTRKPFSAAERMRLLRMRLLRARRRNGLRCAIVMPHETEIDRLMEKGFLQSQRRHDHVAIENAIGVFICYALGEPRGNPHLLAVRTAVNASPGPRRPGRAAG